MLRWCLDGSHVKILHYLHEVAWECRELKLSFCRPQANGLFKHSLACHKCFLVFHFHLISHFEHDHFTCPQTIEGLKIGQGVNSLSFGRKLVNSKYQIPENCKVEVSTEALVWRGFKIGGLRMREPTLGSPNMEKRLTSTRKDKKFSVGKTRTSLQNTVVSTSVNKEDLQIQHPSQSVWTLGGVPTCKSHFYI